MAVELKSIAAIAFCVLALPVVAAADDNFDFASYPASKAYNGVPHKPRFVGKNVPLADFSTLIQEGMAAGPVFAGEYAVIQFGCGTGCTGVIVANNRTGELYQFPRGGEYNQALTLQFDLKSSLMLARWYTGSSWETCIFEAFAFKDGSWNAKEAVAGKGDAVCESDIVHGAAKAKE